MVEKGWDQGLVSAHGQWFWSRHASDNKLSPYLALLYQRRIKHEQSWSVIPLGAQNSTVADHGHAVEGIHTENHSPLKLMKNDSIQDRQLLIWNQSRVLTLAMLLQIGLEEWARLGDEPRVVCMAWMLHGCLLSYSGQFVSKLNLWCLVVVSASFNELMPFCKAGTNRTD